MIVFSEIIHVQFLLDMFVYVDVFGSRDQEMLVSVFKAQNSPDGLLFSLSIRHLQFFYNIEVKHAQIWLYSIMKSGRNYRFIVIAIHFERLQLFTQTCVKT